MPVDSSYFWWDVIDGDKSAVESVLKCHKFADESSVFLPTNPITPELQGFRCEWSGSASLQAQFLLVSQAFREKEN